MHTNSNIYANQGEYLGENAGMPFPMVTGGFGLMLAYVFPGGLTGGQGFLIGFVVGILIPGLMAFGSKKS